MIGIAVFDFMNEKYLKPMVFPTQLGQNILIQWLRLFGRPSFWFVLSASLSYAAMSS